MKTRALRWLIGVLAAVVVSLAAFQAFGSFTDNHDAWDLFAPVSVESEPVTIKPARLFSSGQQTSINEVVNETRGFGVPWSVYVTTDEVENRDGPIDTWAEQVYDEAPVETAPGARDGLLLFVAVPVDDHTQTHAEFVAGEQFFPRQGITPETLERIVNEQMAPLIEDNKIGQAVIEGTTWLEWSQLFQSTPNQPDTYLQSGLDPLLHPFLTIAMVGLAGAVALVAIGILWETWRGSIGVAQGEFEVASAAAAAIGRVNDAVIDALQTPTAERVHEPADTPMTPVTETRPQSDPRAIRGSLEDQLAANGVFHPRSVLYTLWLRALAGFALAAGLLGIVLSILGESEPTLFASIAAVAISLVALIWNESRSWTTNAGRQRLRDWKALHADAQDDAWVQFDAIVHADHYRADLGSPLSRSWNPSAGA